jgi:hypothetical protein
MSEENKRIVEINGVKVEIDLRNAKVIEHYKVGDPVRVYHPKSDYRGAEIRAGVIVGFCEFEKTPAIEILELEDSYNSITFKSVVVSGELNNDLQIAPYDRYEGLISQANVVTRFDRQIQQKELELSDLKLKKKYFIDDFAKAFQQIVPHASSE